MQNIIQAYYLDFHMTFAPEREYISRILSFANENSGSYTKEEISEQTAIPTGKVSGKVEPHINYAAAMGLITYEKVAGEYKIELTVLGRIVLLEDPYLVENVSKLLLHGLLVDSNSPAILWSYMFNDFFPKVNENFTHEQVTKAVERNFEKKVNMSPFRTCYTSELSFESLNLLEIEDNSYGIKPHRMKKEYLYVYAYLLINKWEQLLVERSELTIDEVMGTLHYGKALFWNEKQVRDALDIMQDASLIKINAQLSPITIIKNQNANYCLNKLFSLLI